MRSDGPAAEKLAAEVLQRNGLRLVESNFRCRFGEIDLILLDGDTIVFAEVRLRSNALFGGASASITPAKQEKIIRTAQYYLQRNPARGGCRFDVLLMGNLDAGQVEWIKNAFEGA